MITELTPETYFEQLNIEGLLHMVMCYGTTCGPCKSTMPIYQATVDHFEEYQMKNIKFYKFDHWEPTNKAFIAENKLTVSGVPTFKYYYMGDAINQNTKGYSDPNELKRHILDTVKAIDSTMGGFSLI